MDEGQWHWVTLIMDRNSDTEWHWWWTKDNDTDWHMMDNVQWHWLTLMMYKGQWRGSVTLTDTNSISVACQRCLRFYQVSGSRSATAGTGHCCYICDRRFLRKRIRVLVQTRQKHAVTDVLERAREKQKSQKPLRAHRGHWWPKTLPHSHEASTP